MNKEQLTILSQIYNSLLLVSTKGEDTMIMGPCLSALRQFILENKEVENDNIGEG